MFAKTYCFSLCVIAIAFSYILENLFFLLALACYSHRICFFQWSIFLMYYSHCMFSSFTLIHKDITYKSRYQMVLNILKWCQHGGVNFQHGWSYHRIEMVSGGVMIVPRQHGGVNILTTCRCQHIDNLVPRS